MQSFFSSTFRQIILRTGFIPILIFGLENTCFAQPIYSLSTIPPVNFNHAAQAITFELKTNKHIRLREIVLTGSSNGIHNLEIRIRKGGVQSQSGKAPIIADTAGWQLLGTKRMYNLGLVPYMSTMDSLDDILEPGVYGINLKTTDGYTLGANLHTGLSAIDSVTDGTVVIRFSAGKGYRSLFSGPYAFPYVDTTNGYEIPCYWNYSLFEKLSNNVAVDGIDSISNKCSGSHPVFARLRNYGKNQINQVTVNWSVDGLLQTPVQFTGLIDTATGFSAPYTRVLLGNAQIQSGNKHRIKIWTTLPNGQPDSDVLNDTANLWVATAISGTYTIDPLSTGPTNFVSFDSAVTRLEEFGVCGPVVINVKEGVYIEQVSIKPIPGASPVNQITFQPASGNTNPVVISHSAVAFSSSATLRLRGARHITFQEIEIESVPPGNGTAVFFERGSSYNTIEECQIRAAIVSAVVLSANGIVGEFGCDGNVIRNNHITGGLYGIRFEGHQQDPNLDLTIEDNAIEDYYGFGVDIKSSIHTIIDRNDISTSGNGNSLNMQLVRCQNIRIVGNTVESGGADNIEGIRLSSSEGTVGNPILIANNLIRTGKSLSYGTRCLQLGNVGHVDILHNNMVAECNDVGATVIQSIGQTAPIRIMNNNILNYGNGYAITYNGSSTNLISNFNNLACSGNNLVNFNFSNVSDLSAWKTNGFDASSISVDSIFSNLDSLRTCDPRIVDAGSFSTLSPRDIDMEMRDNPPNIGADEFLGHPLEFDILPDTAIICNANGQLILGDTVNAPGSVNYNWSTGALTPTVLVQSPGLLTLNMRVACVNAVYDQTYVVDKNPFALFSVTRTGFFIQFQNHSVRGDQYHWDFGDGSSSIVKNPGHTYATIGPYIVVLTVTNNCGQDKYTLPLLTGISDFNDAKLVVYPNPVKDVLNIQFSVRDLDRVQLQLLDLHGRIVVDHDQWIIDNENSAELDVSALKKGLYFLKMTTVDDTFVERIIINSQ